MRDGGRVKVLVCVVNWNTAGHLAACLDAFTGQRGVDHEIAVVDNASVDGSAELVRRRGDVRLVANDRNRGYAGAANQGVALARAVGADALVLANPDAVPAPDHLGRTTGALRADPRRASVQGRLWRGLPGQAGGERLLDTTGHQAFSTRLFRNRGEGQIDRGQYAAGEVFGVSGALATYRLSALEDVAVDGEVFDEDLFAFFEDVDLDWRLQLRGWSAWYEPGAVAWHERGGAGVRRSALVEQLNYTNRFLVVVKNDDPRALVRAAPGVVVTTALKTVELGLTVPAALLRSRAAVRLLPRTLARRRVVQAGARVGPGQVAARWFGPFDYSGWVRTWWGRVTAG